MTSNKCNNCDNERFKSTLDKTSEEFGVCLKCYTDLTKDYMDSLDSFCPILKEFVGEADCEEILD